MKGLGLIFGGSMLAIGMLAQQSGGGLYDLGKVWSGIDAATGGAASATGSVVTNAANSVPVGFLYLATIMFGIRVVMTAPTALAWLNGRNAAQQAIADERAKSADHDRQKELMRIQHAQQIETLKIQADPTAPAAPPSRQP